MPDSNRTHARAGAARRAASAGLTRSSLVLLLAVPLSGCAEALRSHEPLPAAGAASHESRAATYTNGWILLNDDPASVTATLDAAEAHGVTHIQLSHDLIMNIDDVLPAAAAPRVERLNTAIDAAHARGMKVYAWTHELSGIAGNSVCYGPDASVWKIRARAYREGLARLPGLDGIVLMFGSAPTPPWRTICVCIWCLRNFPEGYPHASPPQPVRIRLIVENLAGVIVRELGRELIVRTFVHHPGEIGWHAAALAPITGAAFHGMHKAEMQDWQPYHPADPSRGDTAAHGSFVEMDAAGEYWGLSVLPFAAPEYYAWRLDHMFRRRGVGAAVRVERGRHSAIGTPNEINLFAVSARLADPDVSIDEVWDQWILSFYGVGPALPAQRVLRRILSDTFAIRLKSHYVLGIWALEKGSDLPDSSRMDELDRRGRLQQWDSDWAPVWNAVRRPTRETVVQIWQEASEAVALADESLAALPSLAAAIPAQRYADLRRRLQHQAHAARAWRDVKLFLWARKAGTPELRAWARWAWNDLAAVQAAMEADGLGEVPIAGPRRIARFRSATARQVPSVAAAAPDVFLFGPIHTDALDSAGAVLSFTVSDSADVVLEFGTEIPDFGTTVAVGRVTADATRQVRLSGLAPRERYVARLTAEVDGTIYRSGYHWFFTH